ncbi:HD domain-containing protein [Formosa maritima]|uniref:HD domain-containing protein n=1 Tax=Formosa maritima TaxID=2592046 RepID=A0A5D0G2P9_9FLAO|nr:HD domain-containing protein [Formosa maritima]TYA52147.1 HD domain-containing protein [Formosa maritima]
MTLDNEKTYPDICFQILDELKRKLAPYLSYHSYNHIIDVANVCNNYIKLYKIDDDMAKLIRIAAICHDFGYTVSPIDHEERSITLIEPKLRPILTQEEIDIVSGMIRATKIPQQPKTFYDKILADADLDYLGRNDYDKLSENLHQEFLYFGVIKTEREWLDLQIKFLENHKYHTLFAKWNRRKLKLKKLKELKTK